jgi:ABC-type phosphate transport system auxiliary subunit
MNSDIATVVYSYTFVGIALGSGLLWVGKRWAKHLTQSVLDQVLEAVKPVHQLERNGGSSLADRVDRIETRQMEMMDLLLERLQLSTTRKASNGNKKKASPRSRRV